jgi:hypothetical protein
VLEALSEYMRREVGSGTRAGIVVSIALEPLRPEDLLLLLA